jgi:thiosulfate dehydrogenase [quinone] large subunit
MSENIPQDINNEETIEKNSIEEQSITRRHLFSLIKTGGEVVAVTTLLAACGSGGDNATSTTTSSSSATQAPVATSAATKVPTKKKKVLAHASKMAVNSARNFPIANQKNPGVLIHLPDKSFVAFDSTCTHQQCAVSYNTQSHMLECPCHGAVFDPSKNATPVQGPASTPLTAIKITVHSDGAITQG